MVSHTKCHPSLWTLKRYTQFQERSSCFPLVRRRYRTAWSMKKISVSNIYVSHSLSAALWRKPSYLHRKWTGWEEERCEPQRSAALFNECVIRSPSCSSSSRYAGCRAVICHQWRLTAAITLSFHKKVAMISFSRRFSISSYERATNTNKSAAWKCFEIRAICADVQHVIQAEDAQLHLMETGNRADKTTDGVKV